MPNVHCNNRITHIGYYACIMVIRQLPPYSRCDNKCVSRVYESAELLLEGWSIFFEGATSWIFAYKKAIFVVAIAVNVVEGAFACFGE